MMDSIHDYQKDDLDSTNYSRPVRENVASNSVEKFFEWLRDALSARAKNILIDNELYQFAEFLRFVSSNNNQFVKLRNCGKKTVKELEKLASLILCYVSDPSSIVNIPIEDLDFSARTLNSLTSSHIETLGELASFEIVDIRKFHGLGKKSLQEIEDAVINKGLRFGFDIKSFYVGNGTKPQIVLNDDTTSSNEVGGGQDEIVDVSILSIPIEELGLSVRAFNCLNTAEVKTLGELVVLKKEELLKFRNFGKNSLREIEDVVESKGLRLGMHLKYYYEEETIKQQTVAPFIHGASAFRNLDKTDINYLMAFKEEYGCFPMIFLLYKSLNCLPLREQKIVKMAWGLKSFTLSTDSKEIPDLKAWSVEPILPMSINEIAIEFDLSRERTHQILRKAYRRIKYHDNGVIHFLELEDWGQYGIDKDKPCLLASDLRPGQLVKERDFLIEYIKKHWDKEWICRFVKDVPFISENALCYASLLMGFNPYWIDSNKKQLIDDCLTVKSSIPVFYVDNRLKQYNYNTAIKEVYRLQNAKKTERVLIPINSYFIDNKTYWRKKATLITSEMDNVLRLLIWVFQTVCDAQIENDCIVFEANKVDYGDKLYEILYNWGTRLHRDELFKLLKETCNNKGLRSNLTDSSQITPFLSRDPRIITYGKSSYWGLKEWGESYGSIRELAHGFVKESNDPIHIDKLTKLVMERRPDSNEKSISAIIRQTISTGELLLFYGDYVGLPNIEYDAGYIIAPRSFDDCLQSFKGFVINNKRFPIANQGFEGFLYRWYMKASQLTELTSDEILKIDALEKDFVYYPHNMTEYNFLHKCNLYKQFVEGNNRMLEETDDTDLYKWFCSASINYSKYNDNRKQYFSQLLQYLSSKLY